MGNNRTLKHHKSPGEECRTQVWSKKLWEEIHAIIKVIWAS